MTARAADVGDPPSSPQDSGRTDRDRHATRTKLFTRQNRIEGVDQLEDVSAADLRDALAEIDGSRPSTRLFAALAYRHGVTQTELAGWFDVERKTVYNWLQRLAERPDDLAEAARDDPRPGRPRKLTAEQRSALGSVLEESPAAVGYDAETWGASLLQRHVREAYDVEYSRPTCRRLLDELGEG